MIKVCSLSSGSNGNSFFIQTGEDSFLVDAGISSKQICLRLEQIGSSIDQINGIFITHEHSDHIKGLPVLLKKYPLNIYLSEKTGQKMAWRINTPNFKFINPGSEIQINNTRIQSLPKHHDAVDPSLFCFSYQGKKISVITDAGAVCENIIDAVNGADILFLESNYDENMLKNGPYPYFLKQRIVGQQGHLSNRTAAKLVYQYASRRLSHVFLSHLSENNNQPQLALTTFTQAIREREDLREVKVHLTPRYEVSELVIINPN